MTSFFCLSPSVKPLFSKWLLTVVLCWSATTASAYGLRNYLQHSISLDSLKQCLVMNRGWVTYPAYTDRAGWDQLTGECRDRLIKQGEAYLDYTWKVVRATDYLEFMYSGNRRVMENAYTANTHPLAALLMAELAEGKGRFVRDIANGVFFFCEMSEWCLSAHLPRPSLPDETKPFLDLGACGTAQMLSWIYYFLRPSLDKIHPRISRRLASELNRRLLTPYLEREFRWMAMKAKPTTSVNNWNPWCNSNALLCFMLLEDDPDRLARAVYRSMESVDKFLNYVQADGACEEGPAYWDVAGGKLLDYLSLLSSITGGRVNLWGNEQVKLMGEYMAHVYVGKGWQVNFADATARGNGSPAVVYRYGEAIGSERLKAFAARLCKEHPLNYPPGGTDVYRTFETLRIIPLIAQTPTDHPDLKSLSIWYPETEVFCLRSDNVFLAAKGGYNEESHNHNDVGTFIYYVNDVPLFIDAGVGTYTRQTFGKERYGIWTMQSEYHNLPLINGFGQQHGRNFRSRNVRADLRRATFSLDLSAAYPAGAGIQSWVRSYRLNKGSLDLREIFSLDQPQKLNEIHFLCWGKVDASQPSKVLVEAEGQRAELTYNASDFSLSVDTVTIDDTRLSKVWGKEVYRLSFKARHLAKKGTYRFLITPKS